MSLPLYTWAITFDDKFNLILDIKDVNFYILEVDHLLVTLCTFIKTYLKHAIQHLDKLLIYK